MECSTSCIRIAPIETALVACERSLFNLDATIYLYDLASTYFEGQCARNDKAKRGHSRDHRADLNFRRWYCPSHQLKFMITK